MMYTVLLALIILIAIMILVLAIRLLWRGQWILGWLRGMLGLSFVAFAVLLAFVVIDLYSYKQLNHEEPIATLSFTEIKPQHFKVSLLSADGREQTLELFGDLWQLDARLLKWSPTLTRLGMHPGYRLDRLSGRYYTLEQENTAERSVHRIGEGFMGLDVWDWARDNAHFLKLVDASYGSATYVPMEDGALFQVNLTTTGLLARPLNDRASSAVEGWL